MLRIRDVAAATAAAVASETDDVNGEVPGNDGDTKAEDPGNEDDVRAEDPGNEDDVSGEDPGNEDDVRAEDPGNEDDVRAEDPGNEDDVSGEDPGKEFEKFCLLQSKKGDPFGKHIDCLVSWVCKFPSSCDPNLGSILEEFES